MKYIIANGCEFIGTKGGKSCVVSDIEFAGRFKQPAADAFIKKNLAGDPKWAARKVFDYESGKNYVITTATTYVSNGDPYKTGVIKKARKFSSEAEVATYISKHNYPFDHTYVLSDTFKFVSEPDIKTFTKEQLSVLGVENAERHKRISIPKTTRDLVYERGNGFCALCGRPVSRDEFTIDHILPLNRGGRNEIDNFQIACVTCNRIKNDSTEKELISGAAAILANKLTAKNSKNIIYPLIRSYVRTIISDIYGSHASSALCGGK